MSGVDQYDLLRRTTRTARPQQTPMQDVTVVPHNTLLVKRASVHATIASTRAPQLRNTCARSPYRVGRPYVAPFAIIPGTVNRGVSDKAESDQVSQPSREDLWRTRMPPKCPRMFTTARDKP